jgi:threonine/homoserine/homoserine lactone efflux protein
MAIETWLAFVAASTILLVIPGPTVLLVVSYALGQGWRTALPTAVGVALGDFTAMTLSAWAARYSRPQQCCSPG